MTRRFKKMCEIYRMFAKEWNCDFSEYAMNEMYQFESNGIGNIDISGFNTTSRLPNGFAVGKKWLNVTVSMWFEEMNPNAPHFIGWKNTLDRLYSDPEFPKWWLDQIFSSFIKEKELLHGIRFER